MRKLVKTLLSLSLMAPAAALALGLGDVQLHSDLNQRLNAEIKLLSVNPAEADTIQASLASYEDFAKVGLERPGSLMFLQFDLEQTPSGEYYIKLTSKEAIREPFLDFLVEVKWRSGRVLREYTLLLDPPVSYREAAPVVTTPTTEAAPLTSVAAEDEFVPPPSAIPVAPGVEAPTPGVTADTAETAPEEKASESDMAEALAAGPAPKVAPQASMPSGAIVYGPVKANETLWRIAQKIRPGNDVSTQQMMMALLKANPYAFFDNNINRLKKGYVLRIDDPAMIAAMSKAEAAREVSRQTRVWEDARAAKAAKAAKRRPAESGKAEAPSGAVAAAKKEPKLELVAPEGKSEKPGEGGEDVESLKKEMMLALESSAAQRKENEELQKRVKGLEEQLNDMQRLLSLKDADLAALQKQLREQGQALTLPSEKAGEPAEAALEPKEPVAGETEVKQVSPAEKPVEAGEPAAPAGTATGAKTEAPVEEPAAAKPEPKPEPKPKTKPKPVQKKPAKPRPPAVVEEPSIVDILMDNLNYVLMGVAALFILAILGIWLKRRRGGGFQESILSGGTSSMLNAAEDEMGSETSFLSDLAISGMGGGAIQSDEGEVDPLTEADVFMAYGRNQQAEEVLTKALEKNPGRPDLTGKLLEVYYNLKDGDKFVALAQEAASSLKEDGDVWAKVASMGHELAPDNGLFEGAEEMAQAAGGTADTDLVSDEVLDIGLDIDELTAEMESEGGGEDLGIDLGLDFGDLEEPETSAAPAAEPAETMDFDLDLGSVEESAPEQESAAGQEMDFDFDLGAMETEEKEEPSDEFALDLGTAEAGEEGVSMDFDLGVAEEEPKESAAEGEMDLGDLGDIDFGDLGLDATEERNEPAAEEALDLSSLDSSGSALDEFGDLGDLGDLGGLDDLGELGDEGILSDSDEIATKLDLAQAYIEMGDNEGARSMLEEVAETGNDEQKQQAQELLSKV